jgi:hypothetical protein
MTFPERINEGSKTHSEYGIPYRARMEYKGKNEKAR